MRFGVAGKKMYSMAHGIDFSEVRDGHERKSISKERTFKKDTSDYNFILDSFESLLRRIKKNLVRCRLNFKTVTIKVRYENFETRTHSRTLSFRTDNLDELSKTAKRLLNRFLDPNTKIRLIGVKVSNLAVTGKQGTLMELGADLNGK
jgi:nucleotidyltransferase/DNA polymerase involved in DNA repair